MALEWQETLNATRAQVWSKQTAAFGQEAILDVDGTVAGTTGECKQGMDIAYNGVCGYAPLIVSLANSKVCCDGGFTIKRTTFKGLPSVGNIEIRGIVPRELFKLLPDRGVGKWVSPIRRLP